jgi:hypothetical protein
MKRLLIILSAIVLLAGCRKDAPVDAPELTTMTYNVKAPVQFFTKAAGEGDQINILWCGVYHKEAEDNYVYMPYMSAFVEVTPGKDIKVPLTLIRNQYYKLVFVAQHRNNDNTKAYTYTYNIDYRTGDMALNAPVTDGEYLDVFVKVDTVGPIAGNENREITLDRPVAQINVGTSADELPTTFDLTLTGVPAAYNLFTGTRSQTTVEHTFQGLTPIRGTLSVAGTDYNHMTTLYIFGGNKIGGAITYGQSAKTFSNIDTAPNHKTNIVGNI